MIFSQETLHDRTLSRLPSPGGYTFSSATTITTKIHSSILDASAEGASIHRGGGRHAAARLAVATQRWTARMESQPWYSASSEVSQRQSRLSRLHQGSYWRAANSQAASLATLGRQRWRDARARRCGGPFQTRWDAEYENAASHSRRCVGKTVAAAQRLCRQICFFCLSSTLAACKSATSGQSQQQHRLRASICTP